MEESSREEFEELLRDRTEPGFVAAMLVAMEDLPGYVRDLGMLRTAAAGLQDTAGACTCDDPACLAAPQHKALYQASLDAAVAKLDAAIEETLQAIIDMAWKVDTCECDACVLDDRRSNAHLN